MKRDQPSIGIIGLGVMGTALGINLEKAGFPLTVYNRSTEKAKPFQETTARIAPTAQAAFDAVDVILLLLSDEQATEAVLGRQGDTLEIDMQGKLVVNMATVSPDWSTEISRLVQAAGASYVEAPLSGSRVPAQEGELVVMIAGDTEDTALLQPVFDLIGKQTIHCGEVPNAMRMKLSVNMLLVGMLQAFTEAFHFAKNIGLDPQLYFDAILSGQMANDVLRIKAEKLMDNNLEVQAPLKHAAKDINLICREVERMGLCAPAAQTNRQAFTQATQDGLGDLDVVALGQWLTANPVESPPLEV